MTTLKRFWTASPPLTVVGIAMTVDLMATLLGMAVDQTTILGAPAWLKPTKFAMSSAIYLFTLAWVFTFMPERKRLRAIVGWITAVVLVIEIAIIDAQAARHTTSHFNAATPLDMILFAVMGMAILVLFGSAIALTVALFRHRFADPAFGWALRLGMLLTVLGQATGALMTTPTAGRLAVAQSTGMKVSGSHTVGAPDGGPGLPLTGWSVEHGDLRVPHFVGIHGVQLLPLAAWLLGAAGSAAWKRRAPFVAAAGYYALFIVLLVQALGGHPVVPMMVSR